MDARKYLWVNTGTLVANTDHIYVEYIVPKVFPFLWRWLYTGPCGWILKHFEWVRWRYPQFFCIIMLIERSDGVCEVERMPFDPETYCYTVIIDD
jgi:hypothetical protein